MRAFAGILSSLPRIYFNRGSIFNMSDSWQIPQSVRYIPMRLPEASFMGIRESRSPSRKTRPGSSHLGLGPRLIPMGKVKRSSAQARQWSMTSQTSSPASAYNRIHPSPRQLTILPRNGVPLSFSAPWSRRRRSRLSAALPAAHRSHILCGILQGNSIHRAPDKFHSPYSLQYTASIQQQFGHGWQAQIDYVGNSTVHGPYGLPMSPAVYGNVPANSPKDAGQAPTTGNQSYRFYLTEQNENANGGQMYGAGEPARCTSCPAPAPVITAWWPALNIACPLNFVFMANYTWSHCIDISTTRRIEHYHDSESSQPQGRQRKLRIRFPGHLQRRRCGLEPFRLHRLEGSAYQPLGDFASGSCHGRQPLHSHAGSGRLTHRCRQRPAPL